MEYSKEEEGLYLHGINTNTVEFNTWPSEKVSEVAKEFNLTSVKYITYNNVNGKFYLKIKRKQNLNNIYISNSY